MSKYCPHCKKCVKHKFLCKKFNQEVEDKYVADQKVAKEKREEQEKLRAIKQAKLASDKEKFAKEYPELYKDYEEQLKEYADTIQYMEDELRRYRMNCDCDNNNDSY